MKIIKSGMLLVLLSLCSFPVMSAAEPELKKVAIDDAVKLLQAEYLKIDEAMIREYAELVYDNEKIMTGWWYRTPRDRTAQEIANFIPDYNIEGKKNFDADRPRASEDEKKIEKIYETMRATNVKFNLLSWLSLGSSESPTVSEAVKTAGEDSGESKNVA